MEIREVVIGGETARAAAREAYSRRFWDQVSAGDWEPETFAFLGPRLGPGVLLLDIGAWIGPIALFAARRGARVIALEPDPTAWAELSATAAANPELAIDIRQQAAALRPGALKLYATKDGFGSSESSAVAAIGAGAPIEVPTTTLARLADETRPDERLALKIDIEGYEFALAEEIAKIARTRRAPTLLSLHPRAVFKEALAGGAEDAAARDRALAEAQRVVALFAGMDLRPVRRPDAEIGPYLAERMTGHPKGPRDFELAITP